MLMNVPYPSGHSYGKKIAALSMYLCLYDTCTCKLDNTEILFKEVPTYYICLIVSP